MERIENIDGGKNQTGKLWLFDGLETDFLGREKNRTRVKLIRSNGIIKEEWLEAIWNKALKHKDKWKNTPKEGCKIYPSGYKGYSFQLHMSCPTKPPIRGKSKSKSKRKAKATITQEPARPDSDEK